MFFDPSVQRQPTPAHSVYDSLLRGIPAVDVISTPSTYKTPFPQTIRPSRFCPLRILSPVTFHATAHHVEDVHVQNMKDSTLLGSRQQIFTQPNHVFSIPERNAYSVLAKALSPTRAYTTKPRSLQIGEIPIALHSGGLSSAILPRVAFGTGSGDAARRKAIQRRNADVPETQVQEPQEWPVSRSGPASTHIQAEITWDIGVSGISLDADRWYYESAVKRSFWLSRDVTLVSLYPESPTVFAMLF